MISLLPQLIDFHAQRSPDSHAVHFLQQNLSYAELMEQSNQLANALIELGAEKGERIGIYMDKCLKMSVSLYGIMKAGAAYVPLDPSAPVARLVEIINDCNIKILLSSDNKNTRLAKIDALVQSPLTVLGIDTENCSFNAYSWTWVYNRHSTAAPKVNVKESDLAYIIYTSGSTGKPKGIIHTHFSGLTYARWAANEYKLSAADRLGNHSPLHFDISIFDWFAGAVAGASTIVIPDEYTKFPASYSQHIVDSQMTILFTVPFALIQLSLRGVLNERDMSRLRLIIFGGEPFPIKHLINLKIQLPNVTLDNMYGPAEINGCSHYTVSELTDSARTIPIGKICQIAQSLVVDENDLQVQKGEIGELLVKTPTMMQGYWARPDLNERAFYPYYVKGNQSPENSQQYYRTGDLVQIDEDDYMWFLGRKDRQVKVRGYRVELDEIESILVAHEAVEEAAAYSVKVQDKPLELHAAYTLREGENASQKEIYQYIKGLLPAYAVPTALVPRTSFPRTTSEKIDRTSLSLEAVNGEI